MEPATYLDLMRWWRRLAATAANVSLDGCVIPPQYARQSPVLPALFVAAERRA